MFATLLSVIRLATRVPFARTHQQSTVKSPPDPTDGDFPEPHIIPRRDTRRVYPSAVHHHGLVLTSPELNRPRQTNRPITAVADAAAVIITALPQPSQPISRCSGNTNFSFGSRGPCDMPRTHGLDSLLHLHIGDKNHFRWTPRRLFSRRSFILDDVAEDDHDHDNDHDDTTLLGEDSTIEEFKVGKCVLAPPPVDISQQISRKIVQNQDELLESPEIHDYSNFDWAFAQLGYDSDIDNEPESPTYYSPSDEDISGPHTPLEIPYASSCCIPAHVLLQRLVDAHSDTDSVAAAPVKAEGVNEQKLVEVDDEGQELWVTVLSPAPRCPQRRAKIIRRREDGAGLCPVHRCDLPCVPCDPTVLRYIEF